MRLFRREETPVPEPTAEVVDEKQETVPEPEPPAEPMLPEGADLDALYDEKGQSRFEFEDETGNMVPCDEEGNPIPAERPGFVAPAPEPEPPTPPVQKPQVQFAAPFGDGVLSPDERTAAEERFDPGALALIETMAARIAEKVVTSRDQQRNAAREIGIPEHMVPRLDAMQEHIPAQLKGTREGAATAFGMAFVQEIARTGDFRTALASLVGEQEPPAPPSMPSLPPPVIPPAARMTNPRATPDSVVSAGRARGPKDIANESFHKNGIDGDVISILKAARRR